MPVSLPIDPSAFDPARIPADLARLNEHLRAEHAKRPDTWSMPIDVVRKARLEGKGIFPFRDPDPDAETIAIEGGDGRRIELRVLRPRTREARGTFLHIHGGGWVFGNAAENDQRLRRLAEATGLVTVSVEYRLAPEHPFPAAGDDCFEAALFVSAGKVDGAPTRMLAIGGESAGAHLASLTLLRLRDETGRQPFAAALLVAGCYDLSMTPSVANFGEERLVLNTRDVKTFASLAIPDESRIADPVNSPLNADLAGLPPAYFSCGTKDLLLDDTLFMAMRWAAAGNPCELVLTNGGCHVFEVFGTASGEASLARAEAFLNQEIARIP
ncbi:alpha/beta hydrolase [Fulvimarina endophytica]|uniref:Alpha/beta hydrolase n=1 Tax=Fulvimarina endophytica TaxID=2293836 RepID=A0A371X079_9HYPH|nr:alpha/beta hydrolase [Fulvimarina endophytica]RFC62643.1 alpha/beta hydrolase [Fulvimarina endophytica]